MKESVGAKAVLYPAPALVVGSYDEEGRANVMTAAWGGVVSSQPPCVGVSLRPTRHSYDAVLEREAFTVNIASTKYVREMDYFGLASGRDVDKFEVTGLTPVRAELVDAPLVQEFPVALECTLRETVEIGVHVQVIGEILDVKVDEECLGENGRISMAAVDPCIFSRDERRYFGLGPPIGDAWSVGKEFR